MSTSASEPRGGRPRPPFASPPAGGPSAGAAALARIRERAFAPLAFAAAVGISVLVAAALTGDDERVFLLLALVFVGAALTIALSIPAEVMFLSWLVLAPFLQNSARDDTAGYYLSTLLYTLPTLVFVLYLLVAKGLARRPRWYDALPAGFLLFVLVSRAAADPETLTQFSGYHQLYFTAGIGIVLYYFCAFGPLERLSPASVGGALLLAGAVIAAMTVYEKLTGWNLWGDIDWHFASTPRAVATLSNPGALGTFLGAALVLAVAVLSWDGPRRLRPPSLLMLALGIPGLLFTYTRAPILATGLMVATLLILRRRARLVAAGIAVVAAIGFVASWERIADTRAYQDRFSDTTNVAGRAALGEWSLKLAAERPLAGWGYGQFDEVKRTSDVEGLGAVGGSARDYTSHNTFGTIAVELGALGLALLLVPWIAVSAQAVRRARVVRDLQWFVAALIGVIVVYSLSAFTLDMRFFSLVPALPWLAVGLMRRQLQDR